MTDHKGLPVPQSDAKVALVNEFKVDEERLLRKIDKVLYGNIPLPSFVNPFWVGVARTHFQEGFMALNRAVFPPSRVKLPEDE